MGKKSELHSTSKHLAGLGEGRSRVVIENVKPEIDCGRFAAKRTVGEPMTVEADIFADGHDALSARLLYRREGISRWTEIPMQPLPNDRWRGTFEVAEVGDYYYTVQAW
ncbi:MAG TPA: maltotransferase domain-containing protein, partial [Candidatus Binatia bacterium]|nr:maltotransferase domain-containing protein [Candidatus Binatia bacterium]